jgi:uncharacterized protein YbgA (DUF1722 family)
MATSDDAPAHLLSRRSARARLRNVAASGSFADLVRFHTENKLLLMACDPARAKLMGRIVATRSGESYEGVVRDYRELFLRAMAKAPRRGRVVNAFEHARGYFKDRLGPDEKADFLATLDLYRRGSVPRSAVSSLLETWIRRFGEPYLASQTLFGAKSSRVVI